MLIVCEEIEVTHKKNKKNVILVTGVSKNNVLDSEMAELYISVPSPSLVNDWIDVINKAINNQQILPQVIEELEPILVRGVHLHFVPQSFAQ